MKKLILSLFSLFAVFAGVPHCLGSPAPEEVRASQPGRERRHGGYSKDNWTVYYQGRKVKGASASSFTDLGGGYGKDNWTVFYRGRKVEGACGFVVREPRERDRERHLAYLPLRGAG